MLKVFWRSQEMESFTLKCRNEEQLKLWQITLEKYLEKLKDKKRKKQSIGPASRQSPKIEIDDDYQGGRIKPARPPPPPDFEIKESPIPTGKSYFDSLEDKQENDSIKLDTSSQKRRSSLSFAAQMPSPIPSYKPPPPYDYPHIFSNEGLPKEEKKTVNKAPPRPSPPPLIKLDEVVQPLGFSNGFSNLERPKSSVPATPTRIQTNSTENETAYISPRKAPVPPVSDKFRVRASTDSSMGKSITPTSAKPQQIKVKVHTQSDKYALIIEKNVSLIDFHARIQSKIHINRFRVKYGDEERQNIFVKTDEDVFKALEYADRREDKTLNVFIVADN
eukprot:NODE_193_length_15440_cov_0.478587.p5 type:complete len:333 gc:universal NODE_193_length_15440_cov_0.478587:3191-4189(+)